MSEIYDYRANPCTTAVARRVFVLALACVTTACADSAREPLDGGDAGGIAAMDAGFTEEASEDAAADRAHAQPSDARASDGGTSADPYEAILAQYRAWQPLTEQPYDTSADIFRLCRLPTSAETAFAEGVHGRRQLQSWANPVALSTLRAETPSVFGEGAAIVKEKYIVTDGGTPALAALGIMLKRSSGFDATQSDWEFAYWTKMDGLVTDTTGACSSCHAGPGTTDYVFIDDHWRTPQR